MATSASAERARRPASVPPCTMPNRAWPGLARLSKALLAALGPGERAIDRALDLLARGGQRDAFVELHLDVGAEQALDLDGALGRQQVRGPVDVRLEGDAGIA